LREEGDAFSFKPFGEPHLTGLGSASDWLLWKEERGLALRLMHFLARGIPLGEFKGGFAPSEGPCKLVKVELLESN